MLTELRSVATLARYSLRCSNPIGRAKKIFKLKKGHLRMKRGLLIVLGIFGIFLCTAMVSAQVAVLGNERVTIHEDLTYEVAFAFDFSSTYFFDEKNWSFDFDKNLEDFVVYDEAGILQTGPIVEKNGWKT